MRDDWRDGSKKWDVWAISAMLLECDLDKDDYLKTKDDKEAKVKVRKHLKKQDICKHLRTIWESTLLRKKNEEMISLDEIVTHLHKVRFLPY